MHVGKHADLYSHLPAVNVPPHITAYISVKCLSIGIVRVGTGWPWTLPHTKHMLRPVPVPEASSTAGQAS